MFEEFLELLYISPTGTLTKFYIAMWSRTPGKNK